MNTFFNGLTNNEFDNESKLNDFIIWTKYVQGKHEID